MSLAPALTEVLYALDLGPRVVGVTSFCDWPPDARTKPRVGGYADPSVESILALEPDLVLASPGPGNRDAVLAVERAGHRVALVSTETLEDAFTAIEQVGRLCGAAERGREVAARLRARVDDVARVAASRPKVRALVCVQIDPIIAAGSGTLPVEILERAGGTSVVDAPRYPRIDIETVIAAAPEVILQARMDTTGADRSDAAERDFWSRWSSIPAVRRGRVVVRDFAPVLRAGPRVAEAVEMIAAILHPGSADDAAAPESPR